VISQNLHRRHLSQSQRAVIALDALPLFEAENRKRMSDGGKGVAQMPHPEKSREQAGESFNVSPRYVSDAKAIAAKAPELVSRIRKGFTRSEAIAIGDAIKELERERARVRQAATLAKPGEQVGGDKKTPPTDDGEAGKVRDIVAARVGMSGSTYEKAKAVVNASNAEPERFGAGGKASPSPNAPRIALQRGTEAVSVHPLTPVSGLDSVE
jgi:hypothetical protein